MLTSMGMTEREKRALDDIACHLSSQDAEWSQQFTCNCPSHRPRLHGSLALLCLTALALLAAAAGVVAASSRTPFLAVIPAVVLVAVGVGAVRVRSSRRH